MTKLGLVWVEAESTDGIYIKGWLHDSLKHRISSFSFYIWEEDDPEWKDIIVMRQTRMRKTVIKKVESAETIDDLFRDFLGIDDYSSEKDLTALIKNHFCGLDVYCENDVLFDWDGKEISEMDILKHIEGFNKIGDTYIYHDKGY